jgi:hypothetical protein
MPTFVKQKGGLAQLARVLAWQARGHRFESDILHFYNPDNLEASNRLIVRIFYFQRFDKSCKNENGRKTKFSAVQKITFIELHQ